MTRSAWLLGTWFGCGLSPKAPGTVGTLGALPLYFALIGQGRVAVAIAAVVLFVIGTWAAGIVARESDCEDPQRVVIDEVVGVLMPLAVAPRTAVGVIASVVLFRVFDIAKPWPLRSLERAHGGLGVMLDDVGAGLYAAAVVLCLYLPVFSTIGAAE